MAIGRGCGFSNGSQGKPEKVALAWPEPNEERSTDNREEGFWQNEQQVQES